MVTLRPVNRALVPVSSEAAHRVSAPNYDEFQSDKEVWDLLQQKPENVLRITMAHCHVDDLSQAVEEGGDAALAHSGEQMQDLVGSPLTKEIEGLLWVYEITSPKRTQHPQIGIGGFAASNEIRTEKVPDGSIIRNEGIRPEKAEGRAKLINATSSYIGTVNLAVKDSAGDLQKALVATTTAGSADFEATDEAGNIHRVWLVTSNDDQQTFIDLLAAEPAAYVADGNHRSAAAAALGKDHFLTVFFPTERLGLEPYNRLLPLNGVTNENFLEQLAENFDVTPLTVTASYRPDSIRKLGVYLDSNWYELSPKAGSYDPANGAESIDADIVQRHIIDKILGMSDARDKRINYVGGNKTAEYLEQRVNSGDFDLAISLAPVTMEQFVDVCDQNRFMPPKSTWFDPKVRSGLVIALLD